MRKSEQQPDPEKVGIWNEWRARNPQVRPDLRELSLYRGFMAKCDLHAADMSKSNLDGVNLCDANLDGVNLSEASLHVADMARAYGCVDFRFAFLKAVYAIYAKFGSSNFEGADLTFASFKGADLQKANFANANLKEVNLSGADLRGAHGLETVLDWTGAKLVGADFRDIPWLVVMEITMRPGVDATDIKFSM